MATGIEIVMEGVVIVGEVGRSRGHGHGRGVEGRRRRRGGLAKRSWFSGRQGERALPLPLDGPRGLVGLRCRAPGRAAKLGATIISSRGAVGFRRICVVGVMTRRTDRRGLGARTAGGSLRRAPTTGLARRC